MLGLLLNATCTKVSLQLYMTCDDASPRLPRSNEMISIDGYQHQQSCHDFDGGDCT